MNPTRNILVAMFLVLCVLEQFLFWLCDIQMLILTEKTLIKLYRFYPSSQCQQCVAALATFVCYLKCESVFVSSAKRPAGVTSILSRIGGKKQKMSTLEKSKMDWDAFKSEEGITEELAIHNRGREG